MSKKTVTKKKSPAKTVKLRKDDTILGGAIGWQKAGRNKGRGVFARRNLPKGVVIEISPVVTLDKKSIPDNGDPPDGYALEWDLEKKGQEYCMPLGYVMMYNHSSKPNIALACDYRKYEISVVTLHPVKKGEELRWDYNCEVWFDEED